MARRMPGERTRREFLRDSSASLGAVGLAGVGSGELWAAGRRGAAGEPRPIDGLVARWAFDSVEGEPRFVAHGQREGGSVADTAAGVQDTVDGLFRVEPGRGLALDGASTRIDRAAGQAPALDHELTIQCWLALNSWPWNRCWIVGRRDESRGFSLEVGSRGEIVFQLASAGRWVELSSDAEVLPLGPWLHVEAVVSAGRAELLVDGTPVAGAALPAPARLGAPAELRIGMGSRPLPPAHVHRVEGSHPTWYSLDGFLRELQIYDRALDSDEITEAREASEPQLPPASRPRRLPSGPPGPGRFGATYCRLDYYPEWDAHWPVGDSPDVLVRFDRSPARMVFWRGTRYSPAWVSENGLWMADQSVEAWDPETYEHMNDFHCRYSHVRVLESNPARTVVHWRYAPVSARNLLWREDPVTGWGCWIDELYTIYPDAAGTRCVSWRRGTLDQPRQFQESIPLTHPGQLRRDVIQPTWCTVGNMDGGSAELRYVDDPARERTDLPDELVWQTHHLRSEWQPFIAFEPGNRWNYVRDLDRARLERPGSSNHWPVGQARSDGRSSQGADRAASFLGFPISDPVVHEEPDGTDWWTGLYGMTDGGPERVARLARAWNRSPSIEARGAGARSLGWDRRERAWLIGLPHDYTARVRILVAASAASPAVNPAVVFRGWGDNPVVASVQRRPDVDVRVGYRHRMERTDLVVWAGIDTDEPFTIDVRAAD